jgi:hypothetical protein
MPYPRRRRDQLPTEIQFENLYDQIIYLTPLANADIDLVNGGYQYLHSKAVDIKLITKKYLEALKPYR